MTFWLRPASAAMAGCADAARQSYHSQRRWDFLPLPSGDQSCTHKSWVIDWLTEWLIEWLKRHTRAAVQLLHGPELDTHHSTYFAPVKTSCCGKVVHHVSCYLLFWMRTTNHGAAFISAHHADTGVSHWYLEPWPLPFSCHLHPVCLSAGLCFITTPCHSSFLHANMLFSCCEDHVLGFDWWRRCPLCGQGCLFPLGVQAVPSKRTACHSFLIFSFFFFSNKVLNGQMPVREEADKKY